MRTVAITLTTDPDTARHLLEQVERCPTRNRAEQHRMAVLAAAIRRAIRNGETTTHLHPS